MVCLPSRSAQYGPRAVCAEPVTGSSSTPAPGAKNRETKSNSGEEERAVTIRRAGNGDVRCEGDAEHLAYAFRNLFTGVVREVSPRDELLLETTANGVVTMRFGSGGAAAGRLRQLVTPNGGGGHGDPTLLPLSFRLARGVLERNGGGLTLEERPDESATLVVQLPATQEEAR